MEPKRLSASAVACFESCEARYKATYIDGGRELGGRAATLGTAVHEVLEHAVRHWLHHTPGERSVPNASYSLPALKAKLRDVAASHGLDAKAVAEGDVMIKNFYEFHEANGFKEVIAIEAKETFILKHKTWGPIEFTYIWDLGERDPQDGSIDVTDYKSFGRPQSADDLETKIQVRSYALAAQIKYKDADPPIPFVRVMYFLLRFDVIGMRFDRDANMATYRYLQDVYARIRESDGSIETLNPECQWCVRKGVCETLNRHVAVGGILHMSPEQQAQEYANTKIRERALRSYREELENQLTAYLDETGENERVLPGVRVYLKPTKRRDVSSERAAKIVGPELAAKWGNIGVTIIDKMMKDEPALTDEQRKQLRQIIRENPGSSLEVDIDSKYVDADE